MKGKLNTKKKKKKKALLAQEFDSPRLLADIGGTYARFVLEVAKASFNTVPLCAAKTSDFHAAIRAYLDSLPQMSIVHAAVAIANPVDGDLVSMTNYHWQFSIEEMRQKLGRYLINRQ